MTWREGSCCCCRISHRTAKSRLELHAISDLKLGVAGVNCCCYGLGLLGGWPTGLAAIALDSVTVTAMYLAAREIRQKVRPASDGSADHPGAKARGPPVEYEHGLSVFNWRPSLGRFATVAYSRVDRSIASLQVSGVVMNLVAMQRLRCRLCLLEVLAATGSDRRCLLCCHRVSVAMGRIAIAWDGGGDE